MDRGSWAHHHLASSMQTPPNISDLETSAAVPERGRAAILVLKRRSAVMWQHSCAVAAYRLILGPPGLARLLTMKGSLDHSRWPHYHITSSTNTPPLLSGFEKLLAAVPERGRAARLVLKRRSAVMWRPVTSSRNPSRQDSLHSSLGLANRYSVARGGAPGRGGSKSLAPGRDRGMGAPGGGSRGSNSSSPTPAMHCVMLHHLPRAWGQPGRLQEVKFQQPYTCHALWDDLSSAKGIGAPGGGSRGSNSSSPTPEWCLRKVGMSPV